MYSCFSGWVVRGNIHHTSPSTYKVSTLTFLITFKNQHFDDCYPCKKKPDCNLNHVYRWFMLFILPLCCIIQKDRYKTTTLAILKNGSNMNSSLLGEGSKFS